MPESEKITINMGLVDLGQIDLLVSEGFYSNRTDFIRTAIRNQIATHADTLKDSVKRHARVVGALLVRREELERDRREGRRRDFRVVGAMLVDDDVPVDLALETIGSIKVHGVLRMRPELREALADRIH